MIRRDSVTGQCVLSFRAPRLFPLAKNEAKRPPQFRWDGNAVPKQLAQRMVSKRPFWLEATPLQFGFNRVKDDLGRQYCKIGPEDDRGARGDQVFGHANATPIRDVG